MKLHSAITRILILFLAGSTIVSAQDTKGLPDKLKLLQQNYESAVVRATAPLTKTYLQELQKLKAEYTSLGDLKSAVATEDLISQLSLSPGAPGAENVPHSEMSLVQFKKWLAGVQIIESSGFMNTYSYDGTDFTSRRGDAQTPRKHDDAAIEVGRIFVPFTSTNAFILIDRNMTKATITYSTGEKIDADVRNKSKD